MNEYTDTSGAGWWDAVSETVDAWTYTPQEAREDVATVYGAASDAAASAKSAAGDYAQGLSDLIEQGTETAVKVIGAAGEAAVKPAGAAAFNLATGTIFAGATVLALTVGGAYFYFRRGA